MNELKIFNEDIIPVYTTDTGEKVVIGRELHEHLGIKKKYADWIEQMIGYGFEEGKDYFPFLGNRSDGLSGKPRKEHLLKFDMAKHICMIQRTEQGKLIRQKLIDLEKMVANHDSYLIADPIERAKAWIKEQEERKALELQNTIQSQQIAELTPKATYYDLVLNCKDVVSISKIAKDYGKSGVWLNDYLHSKGIQYKQGNMWLLYQKYADKGYTQSKTHTYNGNDGEQHVKLHTHWTQKGRLFIYELLKADGIVPLIEKE